MSDTITNLIRIPGVQARVVVDADYHWRDLGALLADGFDGEQAELLDALAKGLRNQPEGKSYGGLMQFGIRYSAVGGEYKSYCYQCEYESSYGTRGRAVKCAAAHVTAKHEVDGSEER